MKVSALILGIIGGLIGLGVSFFELVIGGIGEALEEDNDLMGLSVLAFVAAILGLVGGGLALSKPKAAGICLLLGTLLGFVAASAIWIPAGVILFIASLLAFSASRKESKLVLD